MNGFLILILALLVGECALDVTAELLNLKMLRPELPAEFLGVYDAEKYRQSLRYQGETTRFGVIRKCVLVALGIAFILLGGFNAVDLLARRLAEGEIARGLIFTGLLILLRAIAQLPFSIYAVFALEEKFGFNRTTPGTFVLDLAKGALLGCILGAPILAGIIYFFEKAGPLAWLYAWLAVTAFQLVLVYVAPILIMPLFNKFSPVPEGELRASIESYARSQGFELSGVFTMDSSRRSTKANAFFTGFGKFRRLVLFDTLIEKQSPDELVAIVAHEIGHYKLKHIIKFTVLSICSSLLMFLALAFFMNNRALFEAFGMEHLSVYASIIFAGYLYSPVLRVVSVFTHILSRKYEFDADDYSARTYGRPERLISGLKKLSIDNLSHLTPHPMKVLLDYSHPPILKRIDALRAKVQPS